MMMKIRVLILVLLFGFVVFGQEKMETTAQVIKKAEKLFDKNDLYTASDLYQKAVEMDPEDMDATYRLAELKLLTRNYMDAEHYFQIVFERAPLEFPKAQYFYSKCMMRNGNYDDARAELKIFKKKYKGSDKSAYRKKIKVDLKSIDLANGWLRKPLEVKIDHIDGGINRAYTESGPIALGDTGLIFSSMPYDSMYWVCPDDDLNEEKEAFHSKLYTASLRDGEWQMNGEFEGPFNENGKFVGNGAFSKDRKRFYFSKCEELESGKIECMIYESKLVGGQWDEPLALNESINMPGFTNTQPTMGWDPKKKRDVLYFVSDREDGPGGLDIYYSVFDKRRAKDWLEPRLLKKRYINTPGDDMTPHYDMETGTMYFSSDGFPGMGGLDIFKAEGSMKKWGKPTNIGYPLNSGADDLYFVPNESGVGGFMTSNREGGVSLHHSTCCDDLYTFEYLKILKMATKGFVYLENDPNKNPVANSVVSLFLKKRDGEEVLIKTDTTQLDPKNYFFRLQPEKDYKITAYKKGYFTGVTEISTVGSTESDTMDAPEIFLTKLPEKDEGITIMVYFDFNSSALNAKSRKILDEGLVQRLVDNPSLVVEVGAHTDDVGSELANMQLSQDRAKSIVDYCMTKGISDKRLISRGYGESNPVAPNKNSDGSDNPEGRAKNRRVEFKVLDELSEESMYDIED